MKEKLMLKLENMYLRTDDKLHILESALEMEPNDQNIIMMNIWMEYMLADIGRAMEIARQIIS